MRRSKASVLLVFLFILPLLHPLLPSVNQAYAASQSMVAKGLKENVFHSIVNDTYARGADFSTRMLPDGSFIMENASPWIFDGSRYTPFTLNDQRVLFGYVEISSAFSTARIYEDHAQFVKPDGTVEVQSERWFLEHYNPINKQWRDASLSNIVWNIYYTEEWIEVKRTWNSSYSSTSGTFELIYHFEGSLKHILRWTPSTPDPLELGFTQSWSGINAQTVDIISLKDGNHTKDAIFRMKHADGSIAVIEDQTSALRFLNDSSVDLSAGGKKATFTFRGFNMSYPVVELDPVTDVIQPANGDDACYLASNPTLNCATGGTLYSGDASDSLNDQQRSWIKFDVSSISSGAIISSVVPALYEYQAGTGNGAPTSQDVKWYKVTEATGSPVEAQITWNQPYSPGSWTGGYPANTDGTVSTTLNFDSSSAGAFVSWPSQSKLVKDVQGFVNGTLTNTGWIIWGTGENQGAAQYMYNWFYSSDAGGSTTDPKITITYTITYAPTVGEFSSSVNFYPFQSNSISILIDDQDGRAEIKNVSIPVTIGAESVTINIDNSSDPATVSEGSDANNRISSLSISVSVVNSTALNYTLTFMIHVNATQDSSIDTGTVTAYDTTGLSGTGSKSGWFAYEEDVEVVSVSVDDSRHDVGGSVTFTFGVRHSADNSITPVEDVDWITGKIELSGVEKCSDSSLSSGNFSCSVTLPSAVGNNSYVAYLSVTGASNTANQTQYVVSDQLRAPSVTWSGFNSDGTASFTVSLLYDFDGSDAAGYWRWESPSGTVQETFENGTRALTLTGGLTDLVFRPVNASLYGITEAAGTTLYRFATFTDSGGVVKLQTSNSTIGGSVYVESDERLTFSSTCQTGAPCRIFSGSVFSVAPYSITANGTAQSEGSDYSVDADNMITLTGPEGYSQVVISWSASGGGERGGGPSGGGGGFVVTTTTVGGNITTTSTFRSYSVVQPVTPALVDYAPYTVIFGILGVVMFGFYRKQINKRLSPVKDLYRKTGSSFKGIRGLYSGVGQKAKRRLKDLY